MRRTYFKCTAGDVLIIRNLISLETHSGEFLVGGLSILPGQGMSFSGKGVYQARVTCLVSGEGSVLSHLKKIPQCLCPSEVEEKAYE